MAAVKAVVVKDSRSVSIYQGSVTTAKNKQTSFFAEDSSGDIADYVKESNTAMSTDSSCQSLAAIATVDNQSKSDVPEENLDATDTLDKRSKFDVPEETTKKSGIELQDKGGNIHNCENSQEGKEAKNIHVDQDLVNAAAIVNSEPKLHNLGKNGAEIATDVQFENIGQIEDSVAMVIVKTEPISDDLSNNSTEHEVDKRNSHLDLPQPCHIQIDLITEDKKLEYQSGGNLEDPVGGSLMAYRDDSDGESDAESSCSSTTVTSSLDSSDVEESNELNTVTKINRLVDVDEDIDEKKVKKNKFGLEDIRTRGEISIDELPPIEDLHITVDEKVKLLPVGQVSSVIGCLVVIQSNQQISPLNEDTVLFLEDRTAIGKVFEIFGPVVFPWYSIRFNSPVDVENKGIKVGTPIFCAPEEENFTKYVFVNALRQLKGSDASWENNNEPPEWVCEFSDDEEEKRAKQKKRNKNRNTEEGTEDTTKMPENKKKRNRQREKTQGNTTVKADPDSIEFAQCQEWPPRDGGPKKGYRYSELFGESQVNPFHNVPEQHHQDRNQHLHFAQRNRKNQWRPQTGDIRNPGFRFGGSPSFSSRFNQPFLSSNCPAEFQMRGPQTDFSSIRDNHSGGQMHRIGNNLGLPQVGQNHSPRMGMLGQDQTPKMGNLRPNPNHTEHRFPPQSEIQPQRNHFSQNQQGPLFTGHNQSSASIGQPPFGGNRFQAEMQGPDLNNNRQMHQGTYQSYPESNAGPHFTWPSPNMSMLGRDTGPQLMGPSPDRAMLGRDERPQFTGPSPDMPMLSKDRNTYQQPFHNYGQLSSSFSASRNFNNQMNHSVGQVSNRGQNYQTGNADSHGFGGPLRGNQFNRTPQGNFVDSRLIYNKNTF
ncbi:hypothetical protein CHS0354_039152 [Potamilus streckersoni]|uniref:H/ACA ribonucleoprotein complex non-core subunit NAF1 n=1 Tax=Potamilus streckersoni TaxID=2493646 RepID=A0AAE0S7H0_9BIVA|nr:hypothetical protein CHS0354_039152 [Potamilus streckersoni]